MSCRCVVVFCEVKSTQETFLQYFGRTFVFLYRVHSRSDRKKTPGVIKQRVKHDGSFEVLNAEQLDKSSGIS